MFKIFILIIFLFLNANASILQKTIDNASIGAILKLPAGIFRGNIVINKPITILGQDGTIIQGEEQGNVITIKSSDVKLDNLNIIKSGKRLDILDSAIFVEKSKQIVIQNCTIKDSLFGIFFDNVSNSKILNNKISLNVESIGLRGDGLRLWFSHDNLIKNNSFIKSRDVALMRSNNNIVDMQLFHIFLKTILFKTIL